VVGRSLPPGYGPALTAWHTAEWLLLFLRRVEVKLINKKRSQKGQLRLKPGFFKHGKKNGKKNFHGFGGYFAAGPAALIKTEERNDNAQSLE